MSKKNMTVVDLFSGCGGFSEGFHLAGFKLVCAIDYWGPARKSIAMNHGKKVIPKDGARYNYDIEEISTLPDKEFNKIIPDSDIIIGSPPCVSFSNSNKSGYADKTLGIKLIEAFMRIVARKKNQPNSSLQYWIMENVPKSKDFIDDEYVFRHTDGKKRYKGQKRVLKLQVPKGKVYNMTEYGVPSKRSRFICGKFIEPKFTYSDMTDIPKDLHLGAILRSIKIKKSTKDIKDPVWTDLILSSKDVTDHGYLHEIAEWQWKRAKRQKRDKGYMGQMSFPENMNTVSRTVMSFGAIASREGFILPLTYSRDRYRHPTIREYATLMSFPLNYQFSGRSTGIKKKQIGNAVPPKFSYELARAINDTKGPRLKRLKAKANMNGEFVDLKDYNFEILAEQERKFKIIFDQHIPYMKIKTYRVVLDNRASNWDIGKIKWTVSIHKGQGDYKALKPYPRVYEKHFTLTPEEINKISELKKLKGGPKDLHKKYRMPLEKRKEENLLGPEELLEEIKELLIGPRYIHIKDFLELEKHDPKDYSDDSFIIKKDGLEYNIPSPILYGYFILSEIFKNYE